MSYRFNIFLFLEGLVIKLLLVVGLIFLAAISLFFAINSTSWDLFPSFRIACYDFLNIAKYIIVFLFPGPRGF